MDDPVPCMCVCKQQVEKNDDGEGGGRMRGKKEGGCTVE